MSQKSSLPQPAQSVSKVLMPDTETRATSATADTAHPARSGIFGPALVAARRAILGGRSCRLLAGQAVQLNRG
jgi:hypothetical protein